jgi:hypothetical protein
MTSRRMSKLMDALLGAVGDRPVNFGELVSVARNAGCNRASKSSISRSLRRLSALGAVELHPGYSPALRLLGRRRRGTSQVRQVRLRVSRIVLTETGRQILAQRSTRLPPAGELLTEDRQVGMVEKTMEAR